MFALKLAVTGFAFWFLLRKVALAELWRAAQQISLPSLLLGFVLLLVNLALAAVRWRVLMQAYDARHIPGVLPLFRVHMVGFFYNTYLPGAVGGDVLRGVATRTAFGEQGTTKSVAVVFIDRVLGLWGLLALTVISTSLFAADRLGKGVLGLGVGLLAALAVGLLVLSRAPDLARIAPGSVARLLARLPLLSHALPFLAAVALAVLGHALVACCGHVLVHAAAPEVRLTDSFVAMPLAAAAAFFPFTIAGAGARDLAMVTLYVSLGYPREVALAGSFALLLTTLITAGLGGLLQLLAPLEIKDRD
jgi:uncharacterized membrane protein YbhN (UPF0104 family)